MKMYLRIAALVLVAGVVAIVFYMMREASKSESRIIAEERGKIAAALDKARAGKDAAHARELEGKLHFLDYRMAVAYNSENKPDQAVIVLNRLIKEAQASVKPGESRKSRNYFDEAKYYDVLIAAYQMKHDTDAVKQASMYREDLFAKAMELKKLEDQKEGHSVGINAK